MNQMYASRFGVICASVACAAGVAGATCWINTTSMCCALSLMGPGTTTTTCTTDQQCGWQIVTDNITLTVKAGSPGKENVRVLSTSTTCTSKPGKCVSGSCVYGSPLTVTCNDEANSGPLC